MIITTNRVGKTITGSTNMYQGTSNIEGRENVTHCL